MDEQPTHDPDSPQSPPDQAAAPASGGGKAVASLVLGIISMVAWCIPLFGLPLATIGLVLGVLDRQSPKRSIAIAGIILCIIALILSVLNAVWGAYLGATGQHALING